MSEVQATKAGFPLVGIALLATIALWVANAAGWIHVAWWVIFLPIAVALAWVLFWLFILAGIAAVVYGAVVLDDRKKKRDRKKTLAARGYVTPSRPNWREK